MGTGRGWRLFEFWLNQKRKSLLHAGDVGGPEAVLGDARPHRAAAEAGAGGE